VSVGNERVSIERAGTRGPAVGSFWFYVGSSSGQSITDNPKRFGFSRFRLSIKRFLALAFAELIQRFNGVTI
jgi:hypothetical protein